MSIGRITFCLFIDLCLLIVLRRKKINKQRIIAPVVLVETGSTLNLVKTVTNFAGNFSASFCHFPSTLRLKKPQLVELFCYSAIYSFPHIALDQCFVTFFLLALF